MNSSLDVNRVKPPPPLANETDVALDMLYIVLVYTFMEDKGFRFNNPCVGVLLRPDLVLTTTSCLEVSVHGAIETELIYIYVRNSQVLRSDRVYVYPGKHDGPNVALVLCETSSVRDFPRLPEKVFDVSDFEHCTLCGFGTGDKNIRLEYFRTTRVNRTEMEECGGLRHARDWICLHFTSVIPCRGDVGTPLLCDGVVHAVFNPPIAHWAPPTCMDSYGATFTRLHPVVPWILKVNSSLDMPVLALFNKPWCWIGLGITTCTIIVIIYLAIMKYVDWRCEKDVGEREDTEEGGPRVIYVRSSELSKVTSRWLWPR